MKGRSRCRKDAASTPKVLPKLKKRLWKEPTGLDIGTPSQTCLLRWWHQHQANALSQEAALIRNQLLQELFVIRRRLELHSHTSSTGVNFDYETSLSELEHIYTQLENLSDRLEYPHSRDSLPLALRHLEQCWRKQLNLRSQLPPTWEPEPVEQTQVLIVLAENWLQQLTKAATLPEHCDMILQHGVGIKELTFHALYREGVPPSVLQISTLLAPMLMTFQLLTEGECAQHSQSGALTWVLRWTTQASNLS